MKKIISFALTLVIIFSFVGCGSMSGEIKDGINSAPTQASTPKPTAIPTPTPTPTPDPRIAMREEYSKEIDEIVANSGVHLTATEDIITDKTNPLENNTVYVAKRYIYNNYDNVWIFKGEAINLLVSVDQVDILKVVDLSCDLAPITDEAMIGQTKNLLNFHLAKFETDHNTGILSQYYTYYDSIACIQSIVGDNTNLCNLILTPANNE